MTQRDESGRTLHLLLLGSCWAHGQFYGSFCPQCTAVIESAQTHVLTLTRAARYMRALGWHNEANAILMVLGRLEDYAARVPGSDDDAFEHSSLSLTPEGAAAEVLPREALLLLIMSALEFRGFDVKGLWDEGDEGEEPILDEVEVQLPPSAQQTRGHRFVVDVRYAEDHPDIE